MLMRGLAEHLQELENVSSRNSMTEMLSVLFGEVTVDEVGVVCLLTLGRLRPLYERLEFNLAEKMVIRAISLAFGLEQALVLKEYKLVGDLGEVALSLRSGNKKQETRNNEISVEEAYRRLVAIAKDGGQGSQERKVAGLADLLKQLDGLSVKYVVRMVMSKLRLGFSDKTILDALSVMETGSKSARGELEMAYQVFPDVGEIARLVKKHGVTELASRVKVTLGVPVMPALCQRLKSADEMVKKMGEVAVEPKYDGTRVQIHFRRHSGTVAQWHVRTFTRNLDETTEMFPELEGIGEELGADEVILDSEAVGVHPKTGKLLTFQATITRKRKHGIEEASRQVPLRFFVFDLLYLDGRELLEESFQDRRAMLERVVREGRLLRVAPILVTRSPEEIRQFHQAQLAAGLEGAVIKQLEGRYIPGRRGWNWVKFKEVEEATGKLSDTLDCVVMGFYRGRGKRSQFGIGAFLVGVINGGEILTVAKIGTGLTDEQWRELKRRLEEVVAVDKPLGYVVNKQLNPDVWVDPAVVVEVAADEITTSPVHSAGKALRFPRLVRFRDDKSVDQVTTVKEVAEIQAA
jgi:DNA ligase-1